MLKVPKENVKDHLYNLRRHSLKMTGNPKAIKRLKDVTNTNLKLSIITTLFLKI